jgi:hypothetical protein
MSLADGYDMLARFDLGDKMLGVISEGMNQFADTDGRESTLDVDLRRA